MGRDVTVGLIGDVMLGRKVDEVQRSRPPAAVWGDLLDRLDSLDGLLINLECCLSTRGSPWTRTYRPFHFRADPGWALPALERAGVDIAALANNHVLDFGETALYDTLDNLDATEIARTGAGRTLDEALEPAVITISGLDVAVVGFTDNTPEFAAGPDSPGTARIEIDVDDEETRQLVDEALARAEATDPDLLVATLHWGPNMRVTPPSPHRPFARWLIDRGADVVHGHSAHVFHGVEVYEGRPIIYDAGDFIDDYAVDSDLRNDRGFLFELRVEGDRPSSLHLIPTEIVDFSVRTARPHVAEWCRRRMLERSDGFGTTFERDGEALVIELGA